MRIVEIRDIAVPMGAPMRNAVIDFSKMTVSAVAVVTDVVRSGEPVVGFGFNANGRYAQSAVIRERLVPRVLEAPESHATADGISLDPPRHPPPDDAERKTRRPWRARGRGGGA